MLLPEGSSAWNIVIIPITWAYTCHFADEWLLLYFISVHDLAKIFGNVEDELETCQTKVQMLLQACNCNFQGSTSASCDSNGKCSCKAFISGKNCDECSEGYSGFPNCKGKFISNDIWLKVETHKILGNFTYSDIFVASIYYKYVQCLQYDQVKGLFYVVNDLTSGGGL